MRWVYLSPHLDDAVFSAGGLIYEQAQGGLPVEIWTYNLGPSQFLRIVVLQNGSVTEIRTGNYGYSKP